MEIDSLVDVHDWVRRRMKTEDIMIAGDLNAGGQFIRQSDWAKCRLRQAGYTWLIPDHVDTTASNTLAAYDRFGCLVHFKLPFVGSEQRKRSLCLVWFFVTYPSYIIFD